MFLVDHEDNGQEVLKGQGLRMCASHIGMNFAEAVDEGVLRYGDPTSDDEISDDIYRLFVRQC